MCENHSPNVFVSISDVLKVTTVIYYKILWLILFQTYEYPKRTFNTNTFSCIDIMSMLNFSHLCSSFCCCCSCPSLFFACLLFCHRKTTAMTHTNTMYLTGLSYGHPRHIIIEGSLTIFNGSAHIQSTCYSYLLTLSMKTMCVICTQTYKHRWKSRRAAVSTILRKKINNK